MTSPPPKGNNNLDDGQKYSLTHTVVLIGLMGAGKTHVGRRLGRLLDVPFFDSDNEIEQAAGMSVSDIFETLGETAFRDAERRVIRRLLEGPPSIIATGGGAYMNSDTRQAIASGARSVWLKASLPVLLARTSRTNRRPLLANGNAETILRDLMAKRYPIYELADMVIDSDGPGIDSTVAQVVQMLRQKNIVTLQ
jgi:shikimate kinase